MAADVDSCDLGLDPSGIGCAVWTGVTVTWCSCLFVEGNDSCFS